MTEKRTGTGRVTYLGAAKPDDPVFKEGWSIYIGPLLGTRPSTPTASTPIEADESEDVLRDPKTDELIRCRYCNSAKECPHLLAMINWDIPRSPSGRCAERFSEFRELVERDFLERLRSGTPRKCSWKHRELDELWSEAALSYSGRDTTVYLDGVLVARLVLDMFNRVATEKYSRQFENAPGPGLASVWTLYYAENPAAVFDAALSELKKLLPTATVPATSGVSRPSRRKSIVGRRK